LIRIIGAWLDGGIYGQRNVMDDADFDSKIIRQKSGRDSQYHL
jgi:hypothetical protein